MDLQGRGAHEGRAARSLFGACHRSLGGSKTSAPAFWTQQPGLRRPATIAVACGMLRGLIAFLAPSAFVSLLAAHESAGQGWCPPPAADTQAFSMIKRTF